MSVINSEWIATHPKPDWLPEFESLAERAISADACERGNAERQFKKWINSKRDASAILEDLMKVIESSDKVRATIVAALMFRNEVFKRWNQLEEEILLLKANTGQSSASPSSLLSPVSSSSATPRQSSLFLMMNNLVKALVDVLLNKHPNLYLKQRQQQQQQQSQQKQTSVGFDASELISARNQIGNLAVLLLKKGLTQLAAASSSSASSSLSPSSASPLLSPSSKSTSESPSLFPSLLPAAGVNTGSTVAASSLTGMYFIPILHQLLKISIDTLHGLAPLNNQSYMCIMLLIELTNVMSSNTEISILRIDWSEFVDAKRIYEKQVLISVGHAAIGFLQRSLIELSNTNSSSSRQQHTVSSPPISLTEYLAGAGAGVPTGSPVDAGCYREILFDVSLEFLEILIVNWNYSYTKSQSLESPNQMYFFPSVDLFPLLFNLPFNALDSSPNPTAIRPAATSPTSSSLSLASRSAPDLFNLLFQVYRASREDPLLFSTGAKGTAAVCRFSRSLAVFSRAFQFKAMRMQQKLLAATATASAAAAEVLQSVRSAGNAKRLLTDTVYVPLLSIWIQAISSSMFVQFYHNNNNTSAAGGSFRSSKGIQGSNAPGTLKIGMKQQDLMQEELQSLVCILLRILENSSDVDIEVIVNNTERTQELVSLVEWLFLTLLNIVTDESDESLISSLEHLTKSFALIISKSCSFSPSPGPTVSISASASASASAAAAVDDTLRAATVKKLSSAATSVSVYFLSEALHVCSVRDSSDIEVVEDAPLEGSDGKVISFKGRSGWRPDEMVVVVGTAFVTEAMSQMAAIARGGDIRTIYKTLKECLERRTLQVIQATSQAPASLPSLSLAARQSLESLYDSLLWTLIFVSFFIVEAADGDLDNDNRVRVIPRRFIQESDSDAIVSDLFSSVYSSLLSAVQSSPPCMPPSIIEAYLSIIWRFIDSYILRCLRYGPSRFSNFTSDDSGSHVLNKTLQLLIAVLQVFSHEPKVTRLAFACLLRAASPETPCLIRLWDLPAFQTLVEDVRNLALTSVSSVKASIKHLRYLSQCVASATSSSEHIKDMARQQENELQRKGTLLAGDLSDRRFQQLVAQLLQPVRVALVNFASILFEKQTASAAKHRNTAAVTGTAPADLLVRLDSQKMADPQNINQLINLLTVVTGLSHGIKDQKRLFYQWISSIIEDIVPSIGLSYALYAEVLESLLKLLTAVSKFFLLLLTTDQSRGFLKGIQCIAQSIVSCHSSSSASSAETLTSDSDDDADSESRLGSVDKAAAKNLTRFYKLLSLLLSHSAAVADSQIPHKWISSVAVDSLAILLPVNIKAAAAANTTASDNNTMLYLFLNLLFKLLDVDSQLYFEKLNMKSAQHTCRMILLGLSSNSFACRVAAAEVLSSVSQYLINQTIQFNLVEESFTAPTAGTVAASGPAGLFSDINEGDGQISPLKIFEKNFAEMGIQILTISRTQVDLPKLQFYSEVFFDILTLLATKAYNAVQFFNHFSDLYAHEKPPSDSDTARSVCVKASESVLRAAVEYVALVKAGQSREPTEAVRRITHCQARRRFKLTFTTFILSLRLDSSGFFA